MGNINIGGTGGGGGGGGGVGSNRVSRGEGVLLAVSFWSSKELVDLPWVEHRLTFAG